MVDSNEQYEVEEVLDNCIFQQKLQFLVAWKGYGYEENSWLNETNVDMPELVQQFYRSNPGAPRHINLICFHRLPFQNARKDA